MLTSQQKAQLGIGLVEEAIVQVLTTQGNSALQTDIQQNLGLGSSAGTRSFGLIAALLADLASQNIIRTEGMGDQTKVQLLAAPSGGLGRGVSSGTR